MQVPRWAGPGPAQPGGAPARAFLAAGFCPRVGPMVATVSALRTQSWLGKRGRGRIRAAACGHVWPMCWLGLPSLQTGLGVGQGWGRHRCRLCPPRCPDAALVQSHGPSIAMSSQDPEIPARAGPCCGRSGMTEPPQTPAARGVSSGQGLLLLPTPLCCPGWHDTVGGHPAEGAQPPGTGGCPSLDGLPSPRAGGV